MDWEESRVRSAPMNPYMEREIIPFAKNEICFSQFSEILIMGIHMMKIKSIFGSNCIPYWILQCIQLEIMIWMIWIIWIREWLTILPGEDLYKKGNKKGWNILGRGNHWKEREPKKQLVSHWMHSHKVAYWKMIIHLGFHRKGNDKAV